MALSIKFTCCLLIILSSVWIFITAQLYQDGKATTEITQLSKTQKEIMVIITAKANTKYSRNIGGRKILAWHKDNAKQAKANKEQLSVNESNNSKVSTSEHSNQGVGGHDFIGRQKKWGTTDHQQAVAVRFDEAAGFVAFNADYSAPRRHPPKNN